jgi:serine/threonine protein kinase
MSVSQTRSSSCKQTIFQTPLISPKISLTQKIQRSPSVNPALRKTLSHMNYELENICNMIEILPIFCSRFKIINKIKSCFKRAIYHAFDNKFKTNAIVKFIVKHNIRPQTIALLQYIKNNTSPYIYNIYEVGDAGGFYIIISKYIEGVTLDKYMINIPNESRIKIIKDILKGIKFLHDNYIQHVDIKPTNIIVSEGEIPIIIDLDSAKIIKKEFYYDTVIIGTIPYIPYEIYEHKRYYLKSDIWSFGVTLIKIFHHIFGKNMTEYGQNSCVIKSLSLPSVTFVTNKNYSEIKFYEEFSKFDFKELEEYIGKKLSYIIKIMVTEDVMLRPSATDLLNMFDTE